MDIPISVFEGWGLILPCFFPCGKAGGLQILRCQGIAVASYGFTLDAPALREEAGRFIVKAVQARNAIAAHFRVIFA